MSALWLRVRLMVASITILLKLLRRCGSHHFRCSEDEWDFPYRNRMLGWPDKVLTACRRHCASVLPVHVSIHYPTCTHFFIQHFFSYMYNMYWMLCYQVKNCLWMFYFLCILILMAGFPGQLDLIAIELNGSNITHCDSRSDLFVDPFLTIHSG